MLIGKQAPHISCQAVINGMVQDFSLDNVKEHYKVLFFYPLDFTFVCPTELHAFEQALEAFKSRDALPIGISVDSVYSHMAWLAQPKEQGGIAGITYPLLSDITKNISRAYEVLDEEKGIAFRGLFLLDKHNTIQAIKINNMSMGRNINEVLRLIDAVKFIEEHGEVCPANWDASKKGLKPTHAGVVDYFHS